MKNTSGFTLLELMITLIISAILLNISIPPMSLLLEKQRINAQTHNIWRLLTKARAIAITSGKTINTCGINEEGQCSLKNIHALVIYEDANRNNTIDHMEVPHIHLPLDPRNKVKIRLARNSRNITYKNNGYTTTPGNVVVCPLKKAPQLIQQVIFNRGGRLYLAPDRDGDGRVENFDKTVVKC